MIGATDVTDKKGRSSFSSFKKDSGCSGGAKRNMLPPICVTVVRGLGVINFMRDSDEGLYFCFCFDCIFLNRGERTKPTRDNIWNARISKNPFDVMNISNYIDRL
jgi:hypothetical protein